MSDIWPGDMVDDRLAFVGTAGSGKTYAAKGLVEDLTLNQSRVCVVDPLGVWWGLRAGPDGDPRGGLDFVIFGGTHADIPITDIDGASVARAIATTDIRCIVDVSDLGSGAARRRFMSAFTEALYDLNRHPLHLVLDEADLWAPQRPLPDQTTLQGKIGEIVRRGRVRGFIPWLITQRPAVLDKDVLSQADVLIAMKLTSSQDRGAIGAWIEGQADREEGKRILADLPRLQRGTGYVWAPSHMVLERTEFPSIRTFDSSRTPKRGESIGAAVLASVDTAAIGAALAKDRPTPKVTKASTDDLDLVRNVAYQEGYADGMRVGAGIVETLRDAIAKARVILGEVFEIREIAPPIAHKDAPALPATTVAKVKVTPPTSNGYDTSLTGPQRQLLAAINWWRGIGHRAPTRAQVAAIAGWKITSGHLKNVSGALRTLGMIDYPTTGTLALTDAGARFAPAPDMSIGLHDQVRSTLTGPQRQVFDAVRQAGRSMTRDQICQKLSWEPTSGHVKNVLGSMRTLELIDYPRPGQVCLQEWLTNV